jgi:transcriptional regulator with XRE-family HTH domain
MRHTPTEADKATGLVVRATRKLAGETLAETVERARLGISPQSLSRIELGEKKLTLPLATKLAAHFNTTTDQLIVTDAETAALNAPLTHTAPPLTEQEWLGNTAPTFAEIQATEPTPLFPIPAAVADHITTETQYVNTRTLPINLDNPLTPAEYREQVWIPYLEHRYNTDQEANSRHAA